MEAFKRRTAPGHPVKYFFHRSSFEMGSYYQNVADWQFEKTKPLYRKNLLAHFGCVNAIEFSKDGSMLVSGGDDRRILLWKMNKALVSKDEPTVMQAEHLSNVFSLDFTCSSEKLISAGNDDQVILHDLATGVPLDYFVHEQPVYGVSADPVNENIFCSACDDGRILIFDIRESGGIADPFCLTKLTSAFHSVMFHPVEPRLIVTSNSKEGVALWDVRMPKRVFVKYGMQNSNQCCMSARFNKMGTQILVLRRRLPPILYSTDSPSHMYQFNHRGYYNSCTMKSCSFAGQNDQFVLSGSDNFDLHVWKIPTPGSDQWVNKAHMVLRGHRSIVNQVRYNYVHNVIASSGVEKIVKLWSPFPMPDERGGKSPAVITNESKRRIYTPDDYVSLVMQAGQGHFMSLTFEGGRKTTREDSRMLAFFDALVQRDINGLSDEDSDNFYETSYTNTVYTSPETSSSENDEEDSNPPDYRSILAAELNNNTFRNRIPRAVPTTEETEPTESVSVESVSSTDNPSRAEDNSETSGSRPGEASDNNDLEVSNSRPQLAVASESLCDIETNQQTEGEDRDVTANMITQLILEKEDSRRKQPRSSTSASNGKPAKPDNGPDNSDDENASSSTARLLKVPHNGQKSKPKSSKHSEIYSNFRKKMLEMRRRERMETPVYDSSRNAPETSSTLSSETSYSRINELMTRSQTASQSDSTLDSSSSSSSDSSSSDKECEVLENQSVIQEKKKKASRPKKSQSPAVVSSDSSSSSSSDTSQFHHPHLCSIDSEETNDARSWEAGESHEPSSSSPQSVSHSQRNTSIDLKRKRRPPCKLNEACKAYLKRYIDSELNAQRQNEESGIPCKRANRNISDSNDEENTAGSGGNLVEKVIFKRLGKHKGRNYRKPSSSNVSGTPPDSGIDVSKEPEACCSKSIDHTSSTPISSVSTPSKPSGSKLGNRGCADNLDDPGYGHIDSSDSSEEN